MKKDFYHDRGFKEVESGSLAVNPLQGRRGSPARPVIKVLAHNLGSDYPQPKLFKEGHSKLMPASLNSRALNPERKVISSHDLPVPSNISKGCLRKWPTTQTEPTASTRGYTYSSGQQLIRDGLKGVHKKNAWRVSYCQSSSTAGYIFWRGPFPFPCQSTGLGEVSTLALSKIELLPTTLPP